jgi:hypothetical protein
MKNRSNMTRRRLLGLGGMAALGTTLPASLSANETSDWSGSGKKGLGIATRNPQWARLLAELRCRWFYSWGPNVPDGKPEDVEFIPMIWGKYHSPERIAAIGDAAKSAGIKELLGYNEPDQASQANMTVEQALDGWPALEETGMRLGSPGCVHPDREWMIDFMKGVAERELRVDFVCVHSYGGPNARGFVNRLRKVHEMFDRPIWITEFAVGDWEAKSAAENRHRPEAVLRFMEEVLPMLDKLDFVERYAWFPAMPDNRALGTSALFDENGALTRLGECYRDA